MRVAAISMAGINLENIDSYRNEIILIIKEKNVDLAVLPAYSSVLLGLSTGALKAEASFRKTFHNLLSACSSWNRTFIDLHCSIACELGTYLAAGTIFERDLNYFYHTAYCFNPSGSICCKQRQTHLTRAEREEGLSRGDELKMFSINGFQVGLVIGNDARHPEVGRIFGLRGADILLYSGAIAAGLTCCWQQTAGMWAQVQQNQFWAVEAQLSGQVADCSFGAGSAIIGPCEITPGQSGYLARGYPETAFVTAELDQGARSKLKVKYPLLELLNPKAYSDLKY